MDYFSHFIPRSKKMFQCYTRNEGAYKTRRWILYIWNIPRRGTPRTCPVDTLNANARWDFELPSHYHRLIAAKIPSEAIESLGCRRGHQRGERGRQGCVTATNDVSANLTLRQIDLSRNPIVACRMFPRVFPFLSEIRSDLVPCRIRDRAPEILDLLHLPFD